MPGPLSDALAWAVVLAFAAGALLWPRRRTAGRWLLVGAWALFAVFWLRLVPHFVLVQRSAIEGVGSAAAVPFSLYAGVVLARGRDSLVPLARAIAWMGAIYLPFETIPAVTVPGVGTLPAPRAVLIRVVTDQTHALMTLLGYEPTLVAGDAGLSNTFRFVTPEGHVILFSLILACTGLGSIAIFVGLIAAVDAPLDRKLRALGLAVPVIYLLNLARTTFIGLVFGKQYMQWGVDTVLALFGDTDPYMVSFYLSDRVISQSLAVVALVGVTALVVRELPELLGLVEEALYLLTRREYDLAAALDLGRAGRAVETAGGRSAGTDVGSDDGHEEPD